MEPKAYIKQKTILENSLFPTPEFAQNLFIENLKTKGLLLVAPHLKVFIKDQASLIRPYFKNMTVLISRPYFSSFALRLPYIKKQFSYLEMAEKTCNETAKNYEVISSKFFTLPINEMQKRNCYLASQNCIKVLSKNAINFDIVHAHFLGNGFIGAKLKSFFGKPLVVTAHGGDVYDLPFRNNWYNVIARYVLNEADQVITVSQFNAEKLLSLGVSTSKLHVIPNGYSEKLFNPIPMLEAREKLSLPFNKKILLAVGNLVEVKGHSYLIDAMNYLLRKRNDVILIIVGSGYLKEALQKKVSNSNLKEKILFVGGKKHEEVPIWMNACDIVVLPSLSEGFPTVIPEALACGKPVIGTKVGGVPEVLSNQDVGILVNPRDPRALADAILGALEKKWTPEIIINYAKQYSYNNLVKQILTIYQALLNI